MTEKNNIINYGYQEIIEVKEGVVPVVKEDRAIFSSFDHTYKVETYFILSQDHTIKYQKDKTYFYHDLDTMNDFIDLLESSGYQSLHNLENICGIKSGIKCESI